VVPADHKHITWLVVSAAIIEALEKLKLEYPKVTGKALEELKACERELEAQAPKDEKTPKNKSKKENANPEGQSHSSPILWRARSHNRDRSVS
jgi:hypothetical protein